LYKTDGLNLCKVLTKCEIFKKYLKQRIETHEIELDLLITSEEVQTDINELEDNYNDIISKTTSSIFEEFKLIYENIKIKAEHDDNGDHDNMQFCPSIGKKLLDFCKLILCWLAIFNYGNITETSATSESLFNDLKSNVFKHKTLPLRIDQFIKIHINSITGSMNLVGSKLDDSEDEINKKDSHENQNKNKINEDEDCDKISYDKPISNTIGNSMDRELYKSKENEDESNKFSLDFEKNDSYEN
jgi:hypothetical protein